MARSRHEDATGGSAGRWIRGIDFFWISAKAKTVAGINIMSQLPVAVQAYDLLGGSSQSLLAVSLHE